MVFSSSEFVFVFLPICLAGYFLVPKGRMGGKNLFLLLASLCFYAWGEPKFVFVMILSIFANYLFGLGAERYRGVKPATRALLAWMAVFNVGILFIFKYLNFTIFNLDRFFGLAIPQTAFVLPIGISFFTFQAMSYVIDVSRGAAEARRNLLDTALFISLFPALIAGPIIRYRMLADQLGSRSVAMEDFIYGIKRFVIGLCKKLIVANTVAACADQAFSASGEGGPGPAVLLAWLGALCYTMQIYFDFSGYSDMAIGLGRMFGFRIPENFNHPYISRTVTEFWRRWHISLSSWFRDYVYIPLGGSRVEKKGRLVFNLFVTWMLTGIWHGANWTFVVWGLFYFALLTVEKLAGIPARVERGAAAGALYRAFTVLCFVCGWVVFRADDLAHAARHLGAMFGRGVSGGAAALLDADALYLLSGYAIILIIAVFFATPAPKRVFDRLLAGRAWAERIIYLALFFLALSFMVSSRFNPFIYFNF